MMKCKLCEHSITDFMVLGICGRCMDVLVKAALKDKKRKGATSEIVPEAEYTSEPETAIEPETA
jgi:hypothetical protein